MAYKSSKQIRMELGRPSIHSTTSVVSNRRKSHNVLKCSKSGIKPCLKSKLQQNEPRVEQKKKPFGNQQILTFRHLPMENLEFHNEIIQFEVDTPNRAAIRMNYLMGSTIVDLNDTHYMKKLYTGLLRQEEENYQKIVKARKLKEDHRVKKLVQNGDMLPPPGMEDLYKSPAFRVAQLLKRLDQLDAATAQTEIKPQRKIIPVEPFEYESGGQYFVHLHKYGNRNFMPPEAVHAYKLKRKAKIQRARERLKAQLEQKANLELNTIYKRPDTGTSVTSYTSELQHLESQISIKLEVEEDSSSDTPPPYESDEEALVRRKESTKRRHLRKKQAYDERDELELVLLFQEREREMAEKKYLRDKEKEEAREEEQLKTEKLQQEQERKYIEMLEKKNAERAKMKPNLAALLNKLSLANVDSQQKVIEESASQKYFRQLFEVPPMADLTLFKQYDNSLVDRLDYWDVEDSGGMFDYGREVKLVYDREQARTDDFLKQGLPQSNIPYSS